VDTASGNTTTPDADATVGTSSGSSLPTTTGSTGSSSGSPSLGTSGIRLSPSTGSTGSSATTASATTYVKQLAGLDPYFVAGNKDDGRGAVITQVSQYLASRLSLFQFIPNGNKYIQYMLMGFLATIQKQLGPNPTIADWQAILDKLLNPQSGKVGPAQRPAAFEPQQIIPQSFQTPYGY
jgi:hypothetical protein